MTGRNLRTLALAACLAVLAAGLSADVIKLDHFPKGKWLDTTWQAYWTFGDDTIELRDVHDKVIYDFAGIVQRLKVEDLDQGGTFNVDLPQSGEGMDFRVADTPPGTPGLCPGVGVDCGFRRTRWAQALRLA
jgi:hypothetical protein